MNDRENVLYRLFDGSGRLLYVGITAWGIGGRLSAHRRKPWGSQIASWTVETYANRVEALRAEATAIMDERPQHNIFQTERMPVRGQRSQYGRCHVCRSLRPVDEDGRFRTHWSANYRCDGSGEIPEPFQNGTRIQPNTFGNDSASRARACACGSGNRDQGTGRGKSRG